MLEGSHVWPSPDAVSWYEVFGRRTLAFIRTTVLAGCNMAPAWPGIAAPVLMALVLVVLYELIISRLRPSASVPLPPGPPREPIIGNLRNFPKANFTEMFTNWKKEYGRHSSWLTYAIQLTLLSLKGDIVYANIFGQSLIILNSARVIDDLLVKRASNFSRRPRSVMANEL